MKEFTHRKAKREDLARLRAWILKNGQHVPWALMRAIRLKRKRTKENP